MSKISDNIETFTVDLLHVNDVDKNKLIDLKAGDISKTYFLSRNQTENLSKYALEVICSRYGKTGNTVLRGSSEVCGSEQILGKDLNDFDWQDGYGDKDSTALRKYIENVYKELALKGNNPLFLSVGAIRWKTVCKDSSLKEVSSPLILFPIKLVRSGGKTSPVYVEFVGDEIYLNPCFFAKLRLDMGEKIVEEFPHPNGFNIDIDSPVELDKLGNGEGYFSRVLEYVRSQKRQDISAETTFEFEKNVVAIAQYNHDELCMYYDIKKNKEKIYSHPLVQRIFSKCEPIDENSFPQVNAQFIMPRDSVQERIVNKVASGQSLIIKGPPGTGKTLTIINLISSLMAQNKRVLLSSQKTAAMFEVFAKLPPELRKFVMLLDSETETQAAKLNVNDVRAEFNELLRERKEFSSSAKVYGELDVGLNQINSAVRSLKNYVDVTYGKKEILQGSYYDALEVLCENTAETVPFAHPKDLYNLTKEEFDVLSNQVEDAGKWFDRVSADHGFIKSPWYPIEGDFDGADIESALEFNSDTVKDAYAVCEQVKGIFENEFEGYKQLPLNVLEFISSNKIDENLLSAVVDQENASIIDGVKLAYECYLKEEKPLVKDIEIDFDAIEEYTDGLTASKVDLSLKKSEFIKFNEYFSILNLLKESGRIDTLKKIIQSIKELEDKLTQTNDAFYSIFSSDISEQDLSVVIDAYESLKSYVDINVSAPKVFDFKAKKLYSKLKNLGYGQELDFAQVVEGVNLYHQILSLLDSIKEAKVKTCSQFRLKLTDEELSTLFAFANKISLSGISAKTYVENFENGKDLTFKAVVKASCAEDYTLSDLVKSYRVAKAKEKLNAIVQRFCAVTGEQRIADNLLNFAKNIVGSYSLAKNKAFGGDFNLIEKCCSLAFKHGFGLAEKISALKVKLESFGCKYFHTFYTKSPLNLNLCDLEIFIAESTDRNIFNAVNEYLDITLNSSETYSLERFFRPFELGVKERGVNSFKQIFTRSVYLYAVSFYQALMGEARNGLGERTTRGYEEYVEGTSAVDKATLTVIENQCMSRINPDDADFAFLKAERSIGETLRRFFKERARAILKLKKCFILSPSTASVFFGREEYENFDIVIIDEASQLEPTAVLPVLFRSKQVVLVGDEWQMPPIRHFTSRSEKAILSEDGEYKILGQNTSVLSLALENCAFPTEKFVCHYRSKTESLISFSQERFYPDMRTFPATLPKADGLGFKDVYIADGRCDGGANVQEAMQAVKEFKEIFERYYDVNKEELTQSIGVVAFGKEQKTLIENLVAKDKELSAKMEKAYRNFNDVPEKLVFFKTIETVQGQECEHLILSITYGKSKTGSIVQSFGELNRGFNEDKLGQCIFNVAVTRAKSSVTVLHSVRSEEITGESVKFIGDYLKTIERFSVGGKAQWVGKSFEESKGFIRQVADYVVSLGIDKERIVIDCGMNIGSVKLPIVILSKDLQQAQLALWCERPVEGNTDFIDYNVRYVESLRNRGWNIVRTYIHDWVDNNASERKLIAKAIEKYVK